MQVAPILMEQMSTLGVAYLEELTISGIFPPHIGDWVMLRNPQTLTADALENWSQIGIPTVMVAFGAVNVIFPIKDILIKN